jgi:transposase
MLYVGLDVHGKFIEFCVLDQQGRVVRRGRVRQVSELLQMLAGLPAPFQVVYEASCGYGCYHEVFEPIAARVIVAHPGHLRLIYGSKRKNDRVDAEKLAKLLLVDAVPTVHVPRAEVRAWRELITFRRRLVEKRTRAKNGVRTLLRTIAVKPARSPGLWSQQGLKWLSELDVGSPLRALQRDLLVDEIRTLSAQIARVERELEQFSRNNALVHQLQSIPGVGLRTAEALVAFLDDPHRFRHSKQVGAYFGLVPRQDQSGNKNRLGHITKDGSSTVRQLLTEAAWQGIRRSPTIKAYFERLQRNDPGRKKIALVGTAHYLARVMWSLLRHGTLWKETVVSQSQAV